MSEVSFPAARAVASVLEASLARHQEAATRAGREGLAAQPPAAAIATLVDAAFWASLHREEGNAPRISLAFLSPEQADRPLCFERPLSLDPAQLARLAPAVERPGIHLGVWPGEDGELRVWGATRGIPVLCLVLEVVKPGLLVLKYRREEGLGKFRNLAVMHGRQVKVVDEQAASLPDCPALLESLLGFTAPSSWGDSANLLVQLAVSMRAHGRGGSLLVVPHDSQAWKESILRPVPYVVSPTFGKLADLLARDAAERDHPRWNDEVLRTVEGIAGMTAVDGATVITDRYELLAFGAKIGRAERGTPVKQVTLTEPVIGNVARVVTPSHLGGTRHLSAAQFTHDQHDSLALVASQDGRFTVFAWSPCESMVHAHRVETLLM